MCCYLSPILISGWGRRSLSRLRHCATSRRSRVRFPIVSFDFFIDIILQARTMVLGFVSASNRNEYQEYFLGCKGGRYVGLTNLPPSCADCLEIWEPQPPGTLRTCPGLQWDCFTLPYPLSSCIFHT